MGAVAVDERLSLLYGSHPPPSGDVADLVLRSDVVPGGGSGVLARTALVRTLGGFTAELRNAEDWELWIRLALHSPVASVDEPLLAYRVSSASRSHAVSMRRAAQRVVDLHAAEYERRGIRFDPNGADRYSARQAIRSGQRTASLIYGRLAVRERRPAYLALAAVALVAPSVLDRAAVRRTRRAVDPAWAAVAEQWLSELPPEVRASTVPA